MTPFYSESGITIYHGDCLQVLRALGTAEADAIITDPPYCSGGSLEAQKNTGGQGIRSERIVSGEIKWFAGDNMTTGGLVWLLRACLTECRRFLKPNRSAFVFTDWRMVPHLAPALESSGLRYRNMIVWDKGSAGLGMGFKPAHEIILEYTNGSTDYVSKSGQNVIRRARVRPEERDHDAQKPVELIKEILRVAVPVGGLVVDPFMGSGSVLVACKEMGVRAIGIDQEERYCMSARDRLRQELLFSPAALCPPEEGVREHPAAPCPKEEA